MFDNNEKDLFGEAGLDLGSDFTEILDGANPFADDSIDSISAGFESVEADATKSKSEDTQIPMPTEVPQNTNSDATISAAEETADKAEEKEEEQNDAQTDLQKNESVPKIAEQTGNIKNDNVAASIFDEAIAKAENKEAENTKSGLIDKLPIFSYAGAKEEIVDTSKNFDQLRIEKAEDFPELDDGSTVSWKMVYGSISKNIPKPKETTIASMKKKIEESGAFLKSLKKAKGDIVCKVTPSVEAKKKGVASYIGAFDSIESAVKSGKAIGYVPSDDGKVYEVRPNKIGTFVAPAKNVKVFSKVRAGFIPALPKIPYRLLMQILTFFKAYATSSEVVEAMVYVYYSHCDNMFYVYVPKQTVSKDAINTTLPDLDDEKFTLVMEIHSHNTMNAFFSGIDDRDERATRLYTVVGHLDNLFPEVKTRASVGGTFIEIEPSMVFEGINEDFPQKWCEAVEIEKFTKKGGLYL